MASYSKTIICGNLGRDPEMRYLANGDPVVNFSVAVTDTWKDKATGEKKESTVWYRVNAFGKLAEICGQYLKKGSSVLIEGKIQTRKWKDKDGVERDSWELKSDSMQMLGGKPEASDEPRQSRAPKDNQEPCRDQPKTTGSFEDWSDMDSDIPF